MTLQRFEEELLRAAMHDAPSAERRARSRERLLRSVSLATAGTGAWAGLRVLLGSRLLGSKFLFATVTAAIAFTGAAVGMSIHSGRGLLNGGSSQRQATTPSSGRSAVTVAQALRTREPSEVPSEPGIKGTHSNERKSLAEEAARLERARACIRKGDERCAANELVAYERRFPKGTLRDEATVLRIDLALKTQNQETARTYASELLRRNPDGPYAKRAAQVLEGL